MILKPFLLLSFLITMSFVRGQLSIKNPSICHDQNNFLKCYNDGTFILNFEKGSFKKFKTVDSTVKYSDVEKTLTIIGNSNSFESLIDTFEIMLRPHSIFIKKGITTLELNSDTIRPEIYTIGFSTETIRFDSSESDRCFNSLILRIGKQEFEIKISTFWKRWSWDIVIRQPGQTVGISYNGYKKNRFENLFIADANLKYGASVSTTFRSLKKISELHSLYVDTIMFHGKVGYGDVIPFKDSYSYQYKKNSRLKTIRPPKDIRRCDCN